MKLQARPRSYLFLIAVFFVIGCDLSSLAAPPPSFPTAAPGAVNTIVAQTAAAAATQTAGGVPAPGAAAGPGAVDAIVAQTAAAAATQTQAALPDTLTPSFTPFPTFTPSGTPSPTVTFVFILKTPTKPPPTKTPTPVKGSGGGGGGSGGGSGSVSWTCKFVGQSPVDGVHFAAKTPFTTKWTVKNTGDLTWLKTSVDSVNAGGTLLASNTFYDTPANVPVGNSETISVPMTAPSKSGTYTSYWSLRVGHTLFCPLSITINVP